MRPSAHWHWINDLNKSFSGWSLKTLSIHHFVQHFDDLQNVGPDFIVGTGFGCMYIHNSFHSKMYPHLPVIAFRGLYFILYFCSSHLLEETKFIVNFKCLLRGHISSNCAASETFHLFFFKTLQVSGCLLCQDGWSGKNLQISLLVLYRYLILLKHHCITKDF